MWTWRPPRVGTKRLKLDGRIAGAAEARDTGTIPTSALSRDNYLGERRAHSLDVTHHVMPVANAPYDFFGQATLELTAVENSGQTFCQRVDVAVLNEHPAHSVLDDFRKSTHRAGNHRYASHHRFERNESQRLRPQRRRRNHPRLGNFALDLRGLEPSEKCHAIVDSKLTCNRFKRFAQRASPRYPQRRPITCGRHARESPQQLLDSFFPIEPAVEKDPRLTRRRLHIGDAGRRNGKINAFRFDAGTFELALNRLTARYYSGCSPNC